VYEEPATALSDVYEQLGMVAVFKLQRSAYSLLGYASHLDRVYRFHNPVVAGSRED
jgi:hypothetical protein